MFKLFKKNEKKTKGTKSAKEIHIESVMEKTGWDYDFTVEQIEKVKEQIGISYKDYDRYSFFDIPDEEKEEKYSEIKERRKRNRELRENCIAVTMNNTGWDREYAEEKIKDARKRLNIKYNEYIKYEFYNIPVEKQEKKYKEIQSKKNKNKKNIQEMKEKTIKQVMELTGWDYDMASEKIQSARQRAGCSYKEYVMYRFYELDDKTQEEFFCYRLSRNLAEKYDVDKKFVKMLCDKELTNECFDKYLHRKWCVNTEITKKDFIEQFKDSKKIIYKPIDGNRGFGVEAFEINEENASTIFDKVIKLPKGVVEEYVVQHKVLNDIAPGSVNTIRVVTVSSHDMPVLNTGEKFSIAYAALRIGGGTSVVDNFHSGGMVAAIDISSGQIVTDAVDMEGNVFERHPMTGIKIKGIQIPFFSEVLELVKDAHEKSGISGYLGWDIAISEEGPVLIEINLRPGVVLLTMPYLPEKIGKKDVMIKYL